MQLLYFAKVREILGRDGDEFDFPENLVTVGDHVDWLIGQGDEYKAAFVDRGRLRFALDQHMVSEAAPVAGAKELAIFPPVTGG